MKLKMCGICGPEILFVSICATQIFVCVHKETCIRILTSALFLVVKLNNSICKHVHECGKIIKKCTEMRSET